ncbi:virulence factor Mce-like protein [Herbihabitans rhizosphaerae]|uniref:Virulence factor Mce-like protein n=1 Tax=Herbihabitans rhizosphaerae TaxID=1872711 RepID=A0A4Q7KLQ3_9PSEU|nr:MCE family protein [Herbihabitans rhizosphaerae]RZS37206.1 virulence factor Mce-like protein [Herbihabitans rhizosphaerae]
MSRASVITLRRRLLGVAFIVVLFGGMAFSIAVYNKVFTPVTTVTLSTDKVGNQLAVLGDVKVRGLRVGEIRKITPTRDGAELELALEPEKAPLVPRNVTARFLPKTLFGERYVALQIPNRPDEVHLREGDKIEQDRSSRAVELEAALDHLLPVLQAVQPQKLSSTLTAISTALQGRGAQLGETLTDLGKLVGEINPHIPQLVRDLEALSKVSDTYSDATPDLVQALTDLTVTSKTIAEQRTNLDMLFAGLTTTSRDLESFLRANRNNLIQLVDTSRPTIELLEKYSPSYPCFLKQMAELVDPANAVMGRGTNEPGAHLTAEINVNRGKYEPGKDTPKFDEHRGPRCYNFTGRVPQMPPDGPLRDGATYPPTAKPVDDGLLPPRTAQEGTPSGSTAPSAAQISAASQGLGLPNTPEERNFLAQLIAPQMGVQPSQVPSWGSLLVGPLYRGAEVTVR